MRNTSPVRRYSSTTHTAGDESSANQGEGDGTEESQRFVIAEKGENRVQYAQTVAEHLDLGEAAARPPAEVDRDRDAESGFEGLDGQLGFHFEPAADQRNRLDERAARSAITR